RLSAAHRSQGRGAHRGVSQGEALRAGRGPHGGQGHRREAFPDAQALRRGQRLHDADVQGPVLVLLFAPFPRGRRETRRRRPHGQGVVNPSPARGPRGPGPLSRSAGWAVTELLLWGMLVGYLLLMSVPGVMALRESVAIRSAVHETTVAFFRARAYAI